MKKFSIWKKDFIIKGFTNTYKSLFFFCLLLNPLMDQKSLFTIKKIIES